MLPTGSLRAGEDLHKKPSKSKIKGRAQKLQSTTFQLLIYTAHLPAVLFPLRKGMSL